MLYSLFLIFLLLLPDFSEMAYTQARTDVNMRFSKQENGTRLVFESADDTFIKNTEVSALKNQIKIQFPENVNLKTQGNPEVETSLKGSTYIITMNAPFTIKTLRLTNPPRLSVDIMMQPKEEVQKPKPVVGSVGDSISGLKIVLDPGHGGYEPGIVSGETREKELTLSLARDAESTLLKKTKGVYLTRKADQYLSIQDRALFANQRFPDIFVSLHLSQSDAFVIYTSLLEPFGPDLSPVELYSLTARQRRYVEKSRALAEELGKAYREEFKKDVIYRKMNLPLINAIGSAALLVEFPRNLVYDQAMKNRLSATLLRALGAYASQ